MPNNNYKKGANFERSIVNKAREDGLIAFRSAGSHSPIDVVIIDIEAGIIDLLQCKAGNSYTEAFKARLKAKHSNLNKLFTVRFDVIDNKR